MTLADIINTFPGTVLGVVGLLTLIFGGFFITVGAFDKTFNGYRRRKDSIEKALIDAYEKRAQQQDEKILNMGTEIGKLKDYITRVSAENNTMKDILQGRDEATLTYQKAGYEAMRIGKEAHEMIVATHQNVNRLAEAVETLAKLKDTEVTTVKKEETTTSHVAPKSTLTQK